ncbi:MAG: polyphosphate kinase 1 [Gammaproteobacteria bacterium]|nr:polyphosphate kinase 1 [Gammaproteobacteria bacterium]
MDVVNLKLPDYYINRELSALEFTRRVLHQAQSTSVPLLERLKFLCIVSTNLDEFFEIRVSGLRQAAELGAAAAGPDLMTPRELLREIGRRCQEIVAEQYELLNDVLTPALNAEGIRILSAPEWSESQREWLQEFFSREIEPVLSPVSLDPARPFPRILNKSLNFIVGLEGTHAFGRPVQRAVVQAPRSLPRLIRLPAGLAGSGGSDFVLLSTVIHAFVQELFTGMVIKGCYPFRVTRNSDLYVDGEEVDDLMHALEGELIASRYGEAVRLEVSHDCPAELTGFLLEMFELESGDAFAVDGPVNLNRLMSVVDLVGRPDLQFAAFTPAIPSEISEADGILDAIRQRDLLLHHPYESFAPVLDFIARSAKDQDVLSIKLTLYRTGQKSPVVDSLVAAAQAGKEVTVIVELRARFDEAENIGLANRLQEAGAHVVYGVVGYKTHCKMALVVRREGGRLRRYAHLGTGNYHPGTARLYTDYGLLTADPALTEDVHQVFLQLTSLMRTPPLQRLHQAPFTLQRDILALIEDEIANVAAGGNGHIVAKMNALAEPEVIRALYRASGAGVIIDLIVRGTCCLRPGVPGVSDNIRVRSIVGRFLEHSRVYYFHANGAEKVLLASADWMERNFFRRIELAFSVDSEALRNRILEELDTCLNDNCQAWELMADGRYEQVVPADNEATLAAQLTLLRRACEPAGS